MLSLRAKVAPHAHWLWFFFGVDTSRVSPEVCFTSDAAVAKVTDGGLGGVLGQRLLATSAVDS